MRLSDHTPTRVWQNFPQLLCCNASRLTQQKFRLFPFRSPLLRESRCFLFLTLLRCFSSGRSRPYPMNSDTDDMVFPYQVSPFRNLWIKAWLAAPQSFWQPSTSFIAFWCQGIHQIPFSISHKFYTNCKFVVHNIKHYLQICQRSQEFFITTILNHKKLLVEMSGVEPLAFRVQSGRSTNWATSPFPIANHLSASQATKVIGGPKSTRTTDLSVISGVL